MIGHPGAVATVAVGPEFNQPGPRASRTPAATKQSRWAARWVVPSLVAVGVAVVGLAAIGVRVGLPHAETKATAIGADAPTIDARFVGRWMSPQGKRILVTRTGATWADPDLLGQIATVAADRIVFAGSTFWCSYRVDFPAPDTADWTLTDNTPSTVCPHGRFVRSFTF